MVLLLTLLLLLLHRLMIRRHVDFVRGEQFTVAFGILEQIFHHFDELVRLLGCHAVEAEAGGLLALPHEVEEEVVQDVAPAIELQEVLSVLHFRRHTLGCSVTAEAGDDTDLSRLLVADEQDVLFFCFLCHFYLLLFYCFMMNDKLSLFGFWKVQKVRKVGIHFLHIFLKENPNIFFSIVGLVLQYPIGKKPLAAIALQRPLADT